MMNEMGIETGIGLDALLAVAEMVQEVIPHNLNSALVNAGKPWQRGKALDGQLKIGK